MNLFSNENNFNMKDILFNRSVSKFINVLIPKVRFNCEVAPLNRGKSVTKYKN